MSLTASEKRRLAGRARTLQERLERPGDDEWTVGDPDRWLDEWAEHLGGRDALDERLAREGLTESECRRRIRANGWPESEPLPEWVERIDRLLGYVAEADPADGDAVPTDADPAEGDGDDEVPFVDLLAVVVEFANDRLGDSVPTQLLSDGARDDLDGWLLERLRKLCSHSLFIEFKTYVAERDPDLAFADDPELPDDPRRYYDSFVASLFEGGLAPFLLEHAFLARLLDRLVEQWVAAVAEFCERLAADRSALESLAGPFDRVTALDPLGDPHGGGRVVFGVTFDSGAKVAYKPRDVGIEVTFYEFVDRVTAAESLPDLVTPTCLDRGSYGWMEWIPAAECDGPEEVADYYRRAGALICVLYALNFTDGHLENVLASGDRPVVVDVETLLEPSISPERMTIDTPIAETFEESVLRTYLFPMNLPDSEFGDISGFGTQRADTSGPDLQTFTDVNTDVMEMEYRRPPVVEGENLPRIDGTVVEPDDYWPEIADGFEAAYRALLDRKDEFLAEGGVLDSFRDTDVRYLHRNTRTYGKMHLALSTPEYLETGLKFGCKAEVFSAEAADHDRELHAVYDAERAALCRLDVPRFLVPADETVLYWDRKRLDPLFETSPLEQARRNVEGMSEDDLQRQIEYVERGFGGVLEHVDPRNESVEGRAEGDVETVAGDAARAAFDRIEAESFEDDRRTWYRTRLDSEGKITIRELGEDAYGGRLGIALTAAALATVTGERRYREFAVETARTVEIGGESEMRLGGSGLGGVVYGFTKLGQLLDEPQFSDRAREAAAELDAERVRTDATYDVISGSAGAVLGLLALYDATGDDAALDRARTAGDHLLSNRLDREGGATWAPDLADRPLLGFGHGTAGIAYALDALAGASGEPRFRETAMAAVEFENARYDASRNNWPTGRDDSGEEFMDAWCYGRTGVGLARLGMYEREEREPLRRDLERALDGLDATTLDGRDHLCCGNAGRIELLLEAARVLDDPAYRRTAERLGTAVADYTSGGEFTGKLAADHWYDPTFLDGEAGVAYTLLRLVEPSLPSVLRLE